MTRRVESSRPPVVVASRWLRALGCIALVAALATCARTPPEKALRQAVGELQQRVEARDAAGVHAMLDEEFIGPDGMDRRGARQLAMVMLMRHRDIGLTLGPLEVHMQGDDRAAVRVTAAVTGGSGALLPDRAQAYRIESAWRRRGDDWRMLSMRWEPVLR